MADFVRTLSFFSQNSLDDRDAGTAATRRKQAAVDLAAFDLGHFDLAIDLRRDEDTRDLLKVLNASHYAGFGDRETYSYLDVTMPVSHAGVNAGASIAYLTANDLDPLAINGRSECGLHLTASIAELDVSIRTDAPGSPNNDGSSDMRTLAVGLHDVFVRRAIIPADADGARRLAPPERIERASMRFGPGWLQWEPWGRWSSVSEAFFKLRFAAESPEIELVVVAQGYTSPSRAVTDVRISAGDALVDHRFVAGDEPAVLSVSTRATLLRPETVSAPFLMRAGRYRCSLRVNVLSAEDWCPIVLRIESSILDQVIAVLHTPNKITQTGALDFPFELDLRDAAEPIRVRMTAQHPSTRSIAIVAFEMVCMQAKAPPLPTTHIETKLLDLVAIVAVRFAEEARGPDDRAVERLTAHLPQSSAGDAVRQLRRRRGRRLLDYRSKPRTFVGIGIGANKETKLWSRSNFADIARRLLVRRNVDLVFIGGPGETDEVRRLTTDLDVGDRAIDLTACCKIEDLGEVLAELDGYIGLDTGTTHFAGRIGLRTFALFGAAHDPAEWGPVGSGSGWAAADVPCSSCSYSEMSQCAMGLQCMTGLTPDVAWPLIEEHLFAGRAT